MYFGIIPLILFIVFLISYFKDPRKMINGLLFNLFICSFLLFCVILSLASDHYFLRLIVIIPLIALFILIPFGIVALMFGLFLNARVLMKREGRRLANSLTLLVAIGTLLFILLPIINPASLFSVHLQPIFGGISLITFYFFYPSIQFFICLFSLPIQSPSIESRFYYCARQWIN